jgi:HK97 family phage prohead protease
MEKNEDYIRSIDGAERRHISHKVEIRAEDDETTIEGVAAVVNKRTNLGWFEEEIMPGAFDNVLQDDVRALFNHDPNFPLARSVNGEGTLNLSVAENGDLRYSYKTPNRTFARDLEDAIKSGDVSQSSFAFSIEDETWIERSGKPDLRQITQLKRLYDVSPVTYPAYADTSVAKRSFDSIKPEGLSTSTKRKRLELKLKER